MNKTITIPKEWKKIKLGDFIDFRNGYAFNSKKYTSGGKIIIRMSNISVDGELNINNSNIKYTDENTFRELSDYQLKKNDLIMCMTDVSKEFGVVGKTAIIDKDDTYILNQRVGRIRLSEELNVNFLHYYTNSKYFLNDIYQKVTGSAQYNLSTTDIKQSKILLPPLPEQQKIAEILSCVDEDIEKTDHIIEETEKLKRGLMQKLLTNGIGHKKFKKTKLGTIPEDWSFARLSEITDLITKGTTPTTYGHSFTEQGVNFIKVENITKDGKIEIGECKKISLITHEFLKRSKLQENDILFSIAGALGRTAIVHNNCLPANTNQAVALIRLREKKLVNFVEILLRTESVIKQIQNEKVQLAQANLSLKKLGNVYLPIPPKDELTEIDSIIQEITNKIFLNKKIKNKLTELKKGLMQDLLSGRVRV